MMPLFFNAPPSAPPALIYAARFYDPRPKVRTYSHLYLWRVGQTGRGTPLTSGAWNDTDPQASPDGKTVFFIQSRDKTSPSVCALDLQTGKVRAVFSGMANSELGGLHVSQNGQNVLIKQTLYTYKPVLHQYAKWFVVPAAQSHTAQSHTAKNLPRLLWSGGDGEDASAAWATNVQILLLHPPRYHFNETTFENSVVKKGSMELVSLAAPNAPHLLPVDAHDFSLEDDVSPDKQLALSQDTGTIVRVAGGKTVAQWSTLPDETLHWLTPRRLVGIDYKGEEAKYAPFRFRFFDLPPTVSNGGAENGPLSLSAWIDLYLNGEATQAALKEYGDWENFYKIEAIEGQNNGFVLGTPWHRGDNGVRFWINAQTGQGTLWSKSSPPHPSPAHEYFWQMPDNRFAEIGKRPGGTPMTEAVQSLYVASYANPARLLPVVTGAAFVYGADWLPVAEKRQK